MFLFLANFGSNATSMVEAGTFEALLVSLQLAYWCLACANKAAVSRFSALVEFAALQYYWWFFLLFALLGSSIAQMVLSTFKEGSLRFGDTLQRVAATIPVLVSSTWCNWIILKALVRTLLKLHVVAIIWNYFVYALVG